MKEEENRAEKAIKDRGKIEVKMRLLLFYLLVCCCSSE